MSIPQSPKPAKLVIGLFMNDKNLFHEAADRLVSRYGGADLISPWFLFDYTTYYEPEMGSPLFRRLISFQRMIRQNRLARIKIETNAIETSFSQKTHRQINIDPGYMLPERFVLASGKNFTHRIYMDEGIYADLTLIYQKGKFRNLPWTYPDYMAQDMLTFLERVRNRYIFEWKQISTPG